MADNLRKYTLQEVLNKVYTDSSGISIGLNSQTAKETLNAVLDSSSNSLNVAVSGGTITGDLTVTGDFKVEGAGSFAYDEILNGKMKITTTDTSGTALYVYNNANHSGTGTGALVTLELDNPSSTGTVLDIRHDGSGDFLNLRATTTEVMTVTSAGMVGIGTSSPSQLLHIEGSSFPTALIKGGSSGSVLRLQGANNDSVVFNDNTADKWFLRYQPGADKIDFYNGGTSTSALTILDSNNNIGIGTTSPVRTLHLHKDTTSTNFIHISNTSTGTSASDGIDLGVNSTDGYLWLRENGNMYFGVNNSTAVTIKNTGSVGIGTDSPSEKLHVVGTSKLDTIKIGDSYLLDVSNNYLKLRVANGDYFAIHGGASDTEYFRLTNDGKVGIGTTSPLALLSVGDSLTSTSTPAIVINDVASYRAEFGYSEGGNTRMWLNNSYANNDATMEFRMQGLPYMTLKGDGKIGIGTASPDSLLTLYDAGGATLQFSGDADSDTHTIQFGVLGSTIRHKITSQASSGDMKIGAFSGGGHSVHLVTQSTTRFKIDDNSRISLSNNDSGTSNTVFGKNAGNDIASGGNYNAFFGDLAGANITTGDGNVAIGYASLTTADDDGRNVAIGQESLKFYNASGDTYNVAVGHRAGYNRTSGVQNTAIGGFSQYGGISGTAPTGAGNTSVGYSTLHSLTSGAYNSGFGIQAGYNNQTGNHNHIFGYQAGYYNETGANNISIGSKALHGASGQSHSNNVGIGHEALKVITTSSNNVAVGYSAGLQITDGAENVLMGKNAGRNGNVANNTYIGFEAGQGVSGSTNAGNNVGVGHSALKAITTGTRNIAIGSSSGLALAGSGDNVFIGANSAPTTTDGQYNVHIGSYSAYLATSGQKNVSVGYASSYFNETGINNTALGNEAMKGVSGNSHSNNTAVGYEALKAVTTGSSNSALGVNALDAITTGAGNVAIGRNALTALDTGSTNVAVGNDALSSLTGTTAGNVGIGYEALKLATSGSSNTAVGKNSLRALTIGHSNVAIGSASLQSEVTGYAITAVGYGVFSNANHDASQSSAQLVSNTGVGYIAGASTTTGHTNTFIGAYSAFSNTTGSRNVVLGYSAMYTPTTANDCVALGNNAFGSASSGYAYSGVVAIGKDAVRGGNNTTTGINGTIGIGMDALTSLTTGTNIAIGFEAMMNLTTGTANTALGRKALNSADGAESNNVAIGSSAMQNANNDSTIKNVAIGADAMAGATSGNLNRCIAIGFGAMDGTGSIDGQQNIFIGDSAGGGTWTGSSCNSNVAIGATAMSANMNGAGGNTALGHDTLKSLTTGDNNTAIGRVSSTSLTTASGSTAVGAYSLDANVGGGEVVAVGHESLTAETFAGQVVAVGYQALRSQNKGGNSYNTAIGSQVGRNVSNGEHNSLMGYRTGETLTTGDENILIGGSSDVSTADAQNQIVIGKGATGVGNNTAIIGNSSTTDVYMGDNGSTWSTTSDGRLKENVEDWNVGLDAINNLRIVSYNFKKDNPYKYDSDKKRQGIIAQEAQKVLPEMVKDDGEWLSANQEPMIWALVNAVQELSAEVNQLKQQLKDK